MRSTTPLQGSSDRLRASHARESFSSRVDDHYLATVGKGGRVIKKLQAFIPQIPHPYHGHHLQFLNGALEIDSYSKVHSQVRKRNMKNTGTGTTKSSRKMLGRQATESIGSRDKSQDL